MAHAANVKPDSMARSVDLAGVKNPIRRLRISARWCPNLDLLLRKWPTPDIPSLLADRCSPLLSVSSGAARRQAPTARADAARTPTACRPAPEISSRLR